MKSQTLEEKVAWLVDRAEIADVIGRYTYGMDSRDWALYRSCWVERVSFDFPDFDMIEEKRTTLHIDDWIRALQAFFANMPQSQHLKAPIRYEFDGDRAVVFSLMQGKHWMPTSTGGPMQTVVGYYRDEFVRTADGWKMCGMKELVHWNEGNAHVVDDNLRKMLAVLKDAPRL